METQFTEHPDLTFRVDLTQIDMFTSLLQAGILVPTIQGTSIGAFLETLPGFSEEFIAEQVQTIFLNGTATDDLETALEGDKPVLALSAAMPGLAGAIFRKNSLHAALRTTKSEQKHLQSYKQTTVLLKLFNTIARDRGSELLRQGVVLHSASLIQFLLSRSTLFKSIQEATIAGRKLPVDEILATISPLTTVYLRCVS